MKIPVISAFVVSVAVAEGAMIRLAFSGTVDEVLVGDLFPVGSPFNVEIDYDTSALPDEQTSTTVTYSVIPTNSRLTMFDGTKFDMPLMFVAGDLESGPGGSSWLLGWGAADPLGAGSLPPFLYSSLSLSIRIPEDAIDDPGRLPSSLDQWDLNAGDLEVTFLHENASQSPDVLTWTFRSTTLSPITLGSIPEPSSVLMLCLGAVGIFRRNRINS